MLGGAAAMFALAAVGLWFSPVRRAVLAVKVCHFENATGHGIVASVLTGPEVRGKAVLLRTGRYRHVGAPAYGENAPFPTADGERPANSRFLGAGVHVLEHRTDLGARPESRARLTVVPPKIERVGTVPVWAFASVSGPR